MAIIWRDLAAEAEKYGGVPVESDKAISFPNGATIYIGGLVDKRMGPRIGRGLRLCVCCVDECQSIEGEILRKFVTSDVNAALTGRTGEENGRLVLAGTPSEFLNGFWYKFVHNPKIKSFGWDGSVNPHMGANFVKMREAAIANAPLGKDDPDVLREWFGLWVTSASKLVVPSFKRGVNEYADLPANDNAATASIGVDLGFGVGNDPTAIVVVASYPRRRGYFVVFEKRLENPTFDDIEAEIRALVAAWPVSKIYIDPANGGRGFADTYHAKHGWPIEAAHKHAKESRLKILDSLIATGRLFAPKDGLFVEEATSVIWDPEQFEAGKKVVSSETPNDIMDAVQYALCDDELLSLEGEVPVETVDPHEDDPELRAELDRLAAEARDPFADQLDRMIG